LQTRAVTEGAMLSAVTVILALLGLYFSFAYLIIPVPLSILVYRHGLRSGIIVSLVSAILCTLVLNSLFVGLELVIVGIMGVAIGLALKEKFGFGQLFIVGVISSVIATVLKFIAYATIAGFNVLDELTKTLELSAEQALNVWQSLGVTEELLQQYSQLLSSLPDLFRVLLPFMIVLVGIIQAFAVLFVIRVILKRLGEQIPWVPPFVEWRLPWYFVWGFILALIFAFINFYYPSYILQAASLNLNVFFIYAFFVQGLAIVWHWMDNLSLPKILRFIFVFLVLFSGWIWVTLIALAGLLDTWIDFRKLNVKKEV